MSSALAVAILSYSATHVNATRLGENYRRLSVEVVQVGILQVSPYGIGRWPFDPTVGPSCRHIAYVP